MVVTGSSRNSLGFEDFYTAKYAGADGTLLWEKRYNGSANQVPFVGNPRLALGPNGIFVVDKPSGQGGTIALGLDQSPALADLAGRSFTGYEFPEMPNAFWKMPSRTSAAPNVRRSPYRGSSP